MSSAGVGVAAGMIVVFVSVEVAGDGFTIVVLFSVAGVPGAGVTTVSRRSHEVKRAPLARMQMMYFVILF
jgi:hypothetical protein